MGNLQSAEERRKNGCRLVSQCNRQYPCNHYSRRRRAEECIYSSPSVDGSDRRPAAPVPDARSRLPPQDAQQSRSGSTEHEPEGYQPSKNCAIAKTFGYFEDSNTNTMTLLRNVDLIYEDYKDLLEPPMQSMRDTVQLQLRRIPDRQIFDFLMQYFVSELNWMKQVIHAPSFLAHYQRWWPKKENPMAVSDIEFATLIALIGSYATLFLPSPSHNVENICGRSLCDIRDTCSDIGEKLAKSCEGGTAQFWEGIASACRAAQKAGIYTVPTDTLDSSLSTGDSAQELEREVRDDFLHSLCFGQPFSQTARSGPFITRLFGRRDIAPVGLISDHGNLPPGAHVNAPDSFKLKKNSPYDPTEREHRYERLCVEYLPTLDPAFAIDHPDMTWDISLPNLPMQRQLLYIAIYDSLYWNFRTVLLLKPGYIDSLHPYKRVLVQSQKQRLGLAAMKTLEAVTTLHSMFGVSCTRFAVIIFNTFEATVLLLYLCAHADFPFEQGDRNTDILGVKLKLTYQRAIQVSRQAVNRLQMLAEMSEMAASGAEVTAQLFIKGVRARQLQSPGTAAPASPDTSWKPPDQPTMEAINDIQDQWGFLEQENPVLTTDMFSSILQDDSFSNLQQSSLEIPMAWRGTGI
ncbi:hypothetical protein BDBG_08545 [Blastomyces gilchristii SLH14081]|uniref:Transcription factor domain-containing protein n=1 Tax=Blastomyces gilchristii (strain SLH14081) TaxID=559298 RepID=A0A179V1W5_BLAGS|nr:uncharacterized protein BDBG_08545 [Blastomyces gilchristii SLH14081]OAT13321.1 hypothetical protein BDBG_08545 [Blastomyces gilchristii SLH14081]